MENFAELKNDLKKRALNTQVARWRVLTSTGCFLLFSSVFILTVIYLYLNYPPLRERGFIVVFGVIFYFCEWILCGYLVLDKNIYAIVRDAIFMCMMLGNLFLGLLVFSLSAGGNP